MAAGGDKNEAEAAGAVAVGEFRIFPGRPLPGLRAGDAGAYHAESLEWPQNEYYAVICDPAAMPRLDVVATVRKVEATGLVTPLEWRIVDWPPTGRHHVAIVYLKPVGGRLVEAPDDALLPVAEDDVVRKYMVPLVSGLSALHAAGIAHGAINPANIVFRDAARSLPMLGECISSAAAMRQPAGFLAIEAAMTAPAARGVAQRGDDIFAFGMTILHLLLGVSLTAGREDEELLLMRIESGSFNAILGENRLSTAMNELLRGLLADEARMRWTLAELEAWLPARRVPAKQGFAIRRAMRPFEFDGKVFMTATALAHGLATAVPAAAKVVRSREFEIWAKRALNEEQSAKVLKLAQGDGSRDAPPDRRDELLVARICILLDALGPIRYRNVAATIEGLGGAFAAAFNGDGAVQPLAEAVSLSIPQFWLSSRQVFTPEYIKLHKTFDQLRGFLGDRRFGFGVERLLYEMNPTLHCLSPLLETEYVMTTAALLAALERRAAADFGGVAPIDRHIAGFIAAKTRTVNQWAEAVSSPDPSQRLLGALRALAPIQLNSGGAPLPGMAKWVGRHARPLIDVHRNRPTRKYLAAKLDDAVEAGQLIELLILLDDSDRASADAAAFSEAATAHARVAAELRKFATDGPRRERQALDLAGQLAAALGSAMSLAAIVAAIIVLV
jgi:eukaryotic-like serine/threonine-protein kinase